MQQLVQTWIAQSQKLKQNLEDWAQAINSQDLEIITNIYTPKARLFPPFGLLRTGQEDIKAYFEKLGVVKFELHYGTLSYHTEENLVEGEYTAFLKNGETVDATFALKFDRQGRVVEHAAAPKDLGSWHIRHELNICTLLTAATVKSVLKREQSVTLA